MNALAPIPATGREAVDAYSANWRTDKMLLALFGPDALSVRNAEERAGADVVGNENVVEVRRG